MLTAGNSPLPRSNNNYQLVRIQKVIDISAPSRIGICGTISPQPILTKQADCILMSTQNVPMDLQISILASDCLQAFVRLSSCTPVPPPLSCRVRQPKMSVADSGHGVEIWVPGPLLLACL